MKVIFPFLFFLVLFQCLVPDVSAQGTLVPFEKGDKWGYKDKGGEVVIPPQFTIAQEFSTEGIAAVVDEEGWAYIDRKGSLLIRPFIFDNAPDYFQEGLARFTVDNKFGFFDKKGKVIIKPKFDFAAPFHEGLAAICLGCKEEKKGEVRFWKEGKWGFINRKGEMVIPPQFDAVRQFENGRARVRLQGKWVSIDKKGKIFVEKKNLSSIGSARMEADGTIVLQLRAESSSGAIGDVLFRYPPGHPDYQEILRHLGGLEKGQEKPVPPWPDED